MTEKQLSDAVLSDPNDGAALAAYRQWLTENGGPWDVALARAHLMPHCSSLVIHQPVAVSGRDAGHATYEPHGPAEYHVTLADGIRLSDLGGMNIPHPVLLVVPRKPGEYRALRAEFVGWKVTNAVLNSGVANELVFRAAPLPGEQ
jgi:hypothetical protein